MSRFRAHKRQTGSPRERGDTPLIFIIEDSLALGLLLQNRVEAEGCGDTVWLKNMAEAREAIAHHRPQLAVTGINLPDAPDGEVLDLLDDAGIPAILFTASLDRKTRDRFASPNIIDYFLKDTKSAVDQIIATIQRVTAGDRTGILIVDDMHSQRAHMAEILYPQNYRILEAGSGAQALTTLAADPDIELVITDYHMPDMDGHELTRRIRALYPHDRLRILGISSSSDPFLSASFLKAGASDFIYRPYIAEEVRCRIGSNIETLGQIKRLRFLAERDSLTGLLNRRAFFERAEPILERLRITGEYASVAIMDIDHFKKVNDTYGHDAGDHVIQSIARMLSDLAASGDILCARFGGEEFVLLCEGRSPGEAQQICEMLRQRVAARTMICNGVPVKITLSIGMAIYQHGEGMDNNLNAADQMLYMAKNSGRNQVVSDALFYNA